MDRGAMSEVPFARAYIESKVAQVPADWIDYNGHMNLAYYVMAFDQALDGLLDETLGIGPALVREIGQGPFVLQNHLHYLSELLEGDPYVVRFLLLDADEKRLHIAGMMHRADNDTLVAVMEQVILNVDHEARRAVPYPDWAQGRIQALLEAQRRLPRPEQIGKPIGLRRRR